MKPAESLNPRAQFDQHLKDLQQDVLRMGSVVEQMLHKAVDAYTRRDQALIREVISMDDIVDRYNFDIETTCLNLLALQNPMARDLRIIAAALKIITDIERVGDYCIDIAKMADRMADKAPLPTVPDLSEMADRVNTMLRETLQAFVNRDLNLIQGMIEHDDEVDHLNKGIIYKMIDLIHENPQIAEQAIGMVMVARYLERIADHITNVGERVYYMETGEHKELHV